MDIRRLNEALYSHYGELGWWPAESPDEVLIGAILTQNTSWSNVEKSIRELKKNGLISIKKIAETSWEALASIIRSSGFYNQKARRLVSICSAIVGKYGGLMEMSKKPVQEISIFLLSLNGIGEETRDSILNYALDYPVFVVDRYTFRILNRTGIMNGGVVDDVKKMVKDSIGDDLPALKNLHAMIVYLGKDFCRTKPDCKNCPLNKECEYWNSR